jgi:hypothetical protein
VARMLVLGALNWTTEWWNPRRGSLDSVVRTAKSLVRNGLGVAEPPATATAPKAAARSRTTRPA